MVSPSETRVDTEPLLEVLVSSCYFADFVPSLGELAVTWILFIHYVRSNTTWVGWERSLEARWDLPWEVP